MGSKLELRYYGDYAFPSRASALYPVWEKAVMKKLGMASPDFAASTSLEPYMATAAASTACTDTTCMRSLLEAAGARKIYLEIPSDPRVKSYARYVIDSERYPIATQVCEFLVQAEGETGATRVLWWSNEAAENMKRESWKVMDTLQEAAH